MVHVIHEATGKRLIVRRPSSSILLQFKYTVYHNISEMSVPLPWEIPKDILKFFLDEQTRHSEQTTNEQFYSDVIIPLLPHTNPQLDL